MTITFIPTGSFHPCRRDLKFLKWIRRMMLFILLILNALALEVAGQENNELLNRQVHMTQTTGTVQFFLNEIAENHPLNFSYDPGIVPLDRQVELRSQDQTIREILIQLFRSTAIKFTIVNDVIILSQRRFYTLSGFIEDKETGESLIGATIIETNSRKGAVSNNYGFFSLTLAEGEIRLVASFVGYKPEDQSFVLKADTSLVFELVPGLELQEVVVSSENLREEIRSSAMSTNKLSMKYIERLPSLLGETDLMKMMQYLPGVQFGTEASSGIVVRGGSPEQNLILLDGVSIYNSNHAFGLFSIFNSDAIKNLSLIKGGFAARYGGRLSSVIDVRMKEGNAREIHGNVTLSTIASKFTIEGPIVRDKSSFFVSARRTYVDLLLPKRLKEAEDYPNFHFHDINAKMNYKLSGKDRVFLSFYTGHDRFTEEENYDSEDDTYYENELVQGEWGNKILLARWNHVYNSKLFSNLALGYSEYGFGLEVSDDEMEKGEYLYDAIKYNSGIKDVFFKFDFDYYPAATHEMKFGLEYYYHNFNPGILRKISEDYYYVEGEKIYSPTGNIDEESQNDPVFANEFRAFLEDDLTMFENWYTNIGMHFSAFLVDDVFYSSIEPRI
jgi:hypothetical protein